MTNVLALKKDETPAALNFKVTKADGIIVPPVKLNIANCD